MSVYSASISWYIVYMEYVCKKEILRDERTVLRFFKSKKELFKRTKRNCYKVFLKQEYELLQDLQDL